MSNEVVPFPELRKLWGYTIEVFGIDNLEPQREEKEDGDRAEVIERSEEETQNYETLRLLQQLSLEVVQAHEDNELMTKFRGGPGSNYEPLLKNPKMGTFLLSLGFVESGDSWTLGNTKLQLVYAVKHYVDTKLGEGHSSENSPLGIGMMMMMGVGDPSDLAEVVPLPDPGVELDLDALIDQVRNRKELPTIEEIRTLCHRSRQTLLEEDNILTVEPPCTVVGDIHGQFEDFRSQILEKGGDPATTRYVFLGDFVDRGENSLLCMSLILLYKIRYPNNVFLLRGNHESRITNTIYGFHEECRQKYPTALSNQSSLYSGRLDSQVWTLFNHLFDAIPLAALVGGKIRKGKNNPTQAFCCHGGLSPRLLTLDRLLTFNRVQDITPQGPMADLTWSDPGPQNGWRVNVRGSGHAFGQDITTEFCRMNGLNYVVRAHQCVKEGFKWDQDNRIVTIFSAPNYCGAQNKGAIMQIDENMETSFVSYEQLASENEGAAAQSPPGYFVTDEDDDLDEESDGPSFPALAISTSPEQEESLDSPEPERQQVD